MYYNNNNNNGVGQLQLQCVHISSVVSHCNSQNPQKIFKGLKKK